MTISVDELMGDPDFFVAIALHRRQVYNMPDGVARMQTVTSQIYGSICPEGGTVEFLPNGQRFASTMTVITKTELIPGDNAKTGADVVVYLGKSYTVKTVNDYTAWGAGFYVANCELIR